MSVGFGRAAALAAAFAVDAAIGDPERPTHPARLMGHTIAGYERLFRRWVALRASGASNAGPRAVANASVEESRAATLERVGGVVLAVGLPVAVFALVRRLLAGLPRWARTLGEVWLLSTALAGTELARSAERVDRGLDGSLEQGREAVSLIVGRDTAEMDESAVVRSAVESVAENTSDAVVAPLVFAALGGAPLALAYKAVSTLDSMVGYRNDRYRHFGWASARLDDAANLAPARATALFAVMAGGKGARALRGAWRDRVHHASPNSGLVEASFAHALDVRLGGPAMYGGTVIERPRLGEEGAAEPTRADLARVAGLSRRVGALALGAALGGLVSPGMSGRWAPRCNPRSRRRAHRGGTP